MPETTIAGRQIRDGAITNAKVAAGAAIDSSKLADGANFVKKDGSVAFTGAQSMGNNKLTTIATPTDSGDAATKGYVDTQIAGLSSAYKYRNVHAATTANITISNPGTDTFDGHALTSGQRLLVWQQSTQSQNGIYVFNGSSSALTRATDSDAWNELTGSFVHVDAGTTYGDKRFYCTSNSGGTLGSTAVTYVQDESGTLTPSNFATEVIPSGNIDGSNTAYTLPDTPTAGTLRLHLNGMRLRSGAGNDYTISTNTITMATAPISGDVLIADYIK
jgi:hypothetical protein